MAYAADVKEVCESESLSGVFPRSVPLALDALKLPLHRAQLQHSKARSAAHLPDHHPQRAAPPRQHAMLLMRSAGAAAGIADLCAVGTRDQHTSSGTAKAVATTYLRPVPVQLCMPGCSRALVLGFHLRSIPLCGCELPLVIRCC